MYKGRGVTVHVEVRGNQMDDEFHITPYISFVLAWFSAAAAGAAELSIPIGFILTSIGFVIFGIILLIRGKRSPVVEPSGEEGDGETPSPQPG